MTADTGLRQRFLDGMSQAAATVNVVTTDGPAGRAGVTVSAMASVSADTPAPALLVCIHHMSAACAAIVENGVFCVNVLRDDQWMISDIFAGRRKPPGADKFSVAEWTTETTGAPRVVDSLVAFDCRLTDTLRVGTHHVFFGEVVHIFAGREGRALVYANRAYGTAAPLAEGAVPANRPGAAGGATLRLATFTTFGPYVVPGVIAALARDFPGLRVDLVESDQTGVIAALRDGRAEIALLYRFGLPDDIACERLAELAPYVLMPAGHHLTEHDVLTVADLANEPFVLLDVPPSRDYFLSLFSAAGLAIEPAFRARSFEMARGMVAHGLGVTLLATKPANNVSYDGRPLAARPLAGDPATSELVLAWPTGAEPGPLAEAFVARCRARFAASP